MAAPVLAAVLALGCGSRSEVVVFCAASLQPVLTDAAAEFERAHGVRVQIQPSGSLVAARKISELGMRADIVAVADADIIDRMLVPEYAAWNIELVTNEIVLAHRDHSAFTDEITTDNWPALLQRPGVRLGCTDPDTAPLGYRTLLAWQLAERSGRYGDSAAGLATRLRARCAAEHVAPDEGELVGLLEARAIEYAFVYRSTAETHHLKITPLPPGENLSRPELAADYAAVAVQIRGRGDDALRIAGAPISYGVTVTKRARNGAGARAFVAFLLGERGQQLLRRAGFAPQRPAPARHAESLPADLRQLVAPTP